MSDRSRSVHGLIAALICAVLAAAQPAWAGPDWTEYDLGEAHFAAPSDWAVVSRIRDSDYVLESPDGAALLMAFWWVPDEPLLGYDDILGHSEVTVAGREALMIRSEFGDSRTLQLAFTEPRANGEQFLITLQTASLDYETLESYFLGIVDRIAFDAEGGKRQASPPSPPPATGKLITDSASGLAFRLPEGWEHYGADLPGARQVLITDPARSVLALIVAPEAAGAAGMEVVNHFETVLTSNILVPRSIEAEGETTIAGAPARWVEITARVYGINNIQTGFDSGTARIYRVTGDRPLLLARVAGPAAGQAERNALEGLFDTLSTGLSTAPPSVAQESIPLPPDRPAPDLNPWLAVLNPELGGDCRLLDLESWQHPVRAELDRQAEMSLHWAALCRNDSYAVFGVTFDYDPRADTDGYFYPLYVTTYLANERRDFAFVETGDDLLITLTLNEPDQLALAYRDLEVAPVPGIAPEPGLTVVETPRPAPTAREEAPEPDAETEPETTKVLFDGAMNEDWRPLSVAGGNFEQFARIEDGALRVDVPAGNGWGKTGIWSAAPDLTFEGPEDTKLLSFEFDPEGTGGQVVVALGQQDHPDEWSSHRLRLAWWRIPEEEAGHLRIYDRTREVLTVDVPPEAPERLDLRVDGRGAVAVSLNGQTIAETALPGWNRQEGYRIYALAHAPQGNEPTRMALRRITMEASTPFAALAPYRGAKASATTLFDGTLGHIWVPHSAAGGDFAAQATLGPEGLTVSAPEGSQWAHTGILSPEPVIWLDDFHGDAETVVRFDIDPAATDGFGLTLTQIGPGGIYSNGPAHPSATFVWAPGAAEFHLNPHRDGEFDRLDAPRTAPDTVTVRLRPGEITLEAEGMVPVTRAWKVAADGAGLRIFAHSRAPEAGAPVRFRLRDIRLEQRPGAEQPAPEPAQGVAPLPVETVFDGRESDEWEPIGVAGGDFAAFARYEDGALRIDVPEGNWWGKTGLMSVGPLIKLNERVWTTPTRITLQLETDGPQTVNFALSTGRPADIWHDHKAWITLTRQPDANRWTLSMRSSPYNTWSREIDGDWMDANWDGRIWIDMGAEWGAMEIPGGPRIRGPLPVGAGYHLYAVVQAHAPADGAAARLDLKKITVGLVTPDGMTAADRWALLDDEAFDPEAFLDDLADFEGDGQ